jgi:lipopolysaccharide transport protein LptA
VDFHYRLFRRQFTRFGSVSFLTLVIGLAFAALPPLFVEAENAVRNDAQTPIRISANDLEIDTQSNRVIFSGNARADQGQTRISADTLTVFYKKGGDDGSAVAADSIELIQARGNVRIEMDNYTAVSQAADYFVDQRKLVVSGPDTKVINDRMEISSGRITYLRNEGKILFDKNGEKQVQAVINASERGLN